MKFKPYSDYFIFQRFLGLNPFKEYSKILNFATQKLNLWEERLNSERAEK